MVLEIFMGGNSVEEALSFVNQLPWVSNLGAT